MNIKQIILLILLTITLIVLSYALLDIIDKHLGYLLIIFLSCMIVVDILLISKLFFRVTGSSGQSK